MWGRSKSKYHAQKTLAYGIQFDSKREARRYQELKELEAMGEIYGIKMQVKFLLIPAQREPDSVGVRGGKIKGRLIEREVAYIADFTYYTKDDVFVVEDVKGMRTPEYIIKRKLLLYLCGIRIKEVK